MEAAKNTLGKKGKYMFFFQISVIWIFKDYIWDFDIFPYQKPSYAPQSEEDMIFDD